MRHFLLALVLAVFCVSITADVHAQGNKRKRKATSASGYGQSQWWVAIKAGMTLAKANPSGTEQSIFSYTRAVSPNTNTSFNSWSKPGVLLGALISFEFVDNTSLIFSPTFTSYIYQYETNYTWTSNEGTNNNVSTKNVFTTRLQYLELPLTVRYEFGTNNTKPFLQAGGYYGYLINAIKEVETTNVDNASGTDSQINSGSSSTGVEPNFINSNLGIAFGAGLSTNIGNARLVLEANYRIGLTNIVNEKNRFDDNILTTGVYDINQNLSIDQLEFALSIFIPLKFITSRDFKAL